MFEKLFKKEKKNQELSISARGNLQAGTASSTITGTGPWRYLAGLPPFILADKSAGNSGATINYALSTTIAPIDGDYVILYCLQSDMTKTGTLIIHVQLVESFVFTITTPSNNTVFKVPMASQVPSYYDISVDWGDGLTSSGSGTSDTWGGSYIQHLYSAAGTYQVRLYPNSTIPPVAGETGWLEAFGSSTSDIVGCLTKENLNLFTSIDTPLPIFAKVGQNWDGNVTHVGDKCGSYMFFECDNILRICANFAPRGLTKVGYDFLRDFHVSAGTYQTQLVEVGKNFIPSTITQVGPQFMFKTFGGSPFLTSSVNDILGSFALSSAQLNQQMVMEGTFFQCGSLTGNFATLPLTNITPSADIYTFLSCQNVLGYNTLAANWK